MNIEQKAAGLLINEWQLGQQLNNAVHNGTRVKFNLLLSLLSDDARDFAQFTLAEGNPLSEKDKNLDLRKFFSLAQPQPLVEKGMSAEQAQQLNRNLQNHNLSSIRLQLLLSNEPFLSRSHEPEIDSDITDNLTLLAQQRLAGDLQAVKSPEVTGIDHQLMERYQALDLENKPVNVTYM